MQSRSLARAAKDFGRRILNAPDRGVAPRTLEAVRAYDRTSEVLVKSIQVLIGVVWAALYAIAPKTDAATAFSPVPYALGFYVAFNAAGLWWALRREMPNWAVYLSIAVDISVLMLLIWSFHVQ